MDKNLKNVILKLVEEVMAEAPAPVIEPPESRCTSILKSKKGFD